MAEITNKSKNPQLISQLITFPSKRWNLVFFLIFIAKDICVTEKDLLRASKYPQKVYFIDFTKHMDLLQEETTTAIAAQTKTAKFVLRCVLIQ